MSVPTDHTDEPIAIIGMACRLPGAENLEEYWRLIFEGRSSVSEAPADRFNAARYFDPQKGTRGKSYSKLACTLDNRDFDATRTPLSAELAATVDLTHRLMTGVAADALRHAGLDPFDLQPKNTAVFIGHAQGSGQLSQLSFRDYVEEAVDLLAQTPGFDELSPEVQQQAREQLQSELLTVLPVGDIDARHMYCNMVAGTVAKAFGLSGSWLAMNSACASSLHAMLLGARALQLGRADMVIVGGASDFKDESLVLFSAAQTLSTDGSRPFDADADGLIMSEGYVALVMKTLRQALADGDPIQAVVRGLGLASDGRGKSLWAPRKEGQMKAMQRAYRAGVDMAGLQYLEAHATSTQVGDATELETLGEVLGPKFPPGKKIPVTSVKANIGHTLECAGISGVIKTVLCMQRQTFPAAINIRSLNPKIDWEKAPYFIPQATAPWNPPAPGQPRRAAVNAFGIGGLNMHVVLDEFTESAKQLVANRPKRPAETAQDRAIAVVGMGCVFPGGIGLPKYWETLLGGHDPKVAPPADRWSQKALDEQSGRAEPLCAGFVTDFAYDWRRHKVPPKQVAEADPLQFMLLEGAEQALNDAGYDRKPLDREMCGVVVGTDFGGDFSDHLEVGVRLPEMQEVLGRLLRERAVSEDQIDAISKKFATTLLKKWPSLIDETGSFTTSTLASRITKTLDLAGGAVALDSGSTSALSGLSTAIDMLLSGDNDVMICAAGQRRMGPNAFKAYQTAGLGAVGAPRNVLDAGYDGVVPAEGVGVVVLKRLADAKRDGDRIHAVIRGLGVAHASTAAEAIELAAQRSCAQAGVAPSDVTLVEIDTDEQLASNGNELQTLLEIHAQGNRQHPLIMGSATAQLGHMGGASGMTALIKVGLEVDHAQTTPVLGLQTPSKALEQASSAVRLPRAAMKWAGPRVAALVSWSKGQAFHLILESATPVAPASPLPRPDAARITKPLAATPRITTPPVVKASAKAPAQTVAVAKSAPSAQSMICRYGAPSLEALQAKLDEAAGNANVAWQVAARTVFQPADRFRAAIVADSADSLARKLQLRSQLQNAGARQVLEQQGVFYRQPSTERPRVAFIFPGQGSQYEGMLQQLVAQSPAAANKLREIDGTMAKLGFPSFAELAWNAPTKLGADVWTTQVAMLLADALVLAALGERNIQPDLVLGHSYGEFAALYAAGVWDFETAVRMTRARCEGISAVAVGDSGMLATDASAEVAESIMKTVPGHIYLANLNAPDQTVVGAKRVNLEKLAIALQAKSLQARILSVPAAFHTPLMAGASRLLEDQLKTVTLQTPRVSFVSTVTNSQINDVAQIRRNLAAQLTTPVRYAELIARLAAERPTVFVEVGPQQTFTKLNRRILDAEASVIACDNPKRPGLEPLVCVQALLACMGLEGVGAYGSPAPAAAVSVKTSHSELNRTSMSDEIPHFDATERRRAKMRDGSAGKPPTRAAAPPPAAKTGLPIKTAAAASAPKAQDAPPAARPAGAVVSKTPAVAPAAIKPAVAPKPAVTLPPVTQTPVSAPAPAVASSPVAAAASEDLAKFLVNFVVEQTGYPPEVVDLDADLEADLGIDSIKKAQLFGELQEYFDIGATATNLSLDDFPTLRHVLNFLAQSSAPAPTVAARAPQVAAEPVAVVAPVVAPTLAPLPVAPVVAETAVASSGAVSTTDPAELEAFLINFVVEQTGYPPEVVELDADLEADLGIDSIKKAQLFGELQEYFDVGASATNLSLDDFPTLRHVLNFLAAQSSPAAAEPVVNVAPATVAQSPVLLPPPAPAPLLEEIILEEVVLEVVEPTAMAAPTVTTNAAELESFLINFVVEQTGYPPEVVELDADLEADLGIDSIKKAQLFGELQEYFDIGATATNLSLDDFPTLRHVLNFLAQHGSAGSSATDSLISAPPPTNDHVIVGHASNGQDANGPDANGYGSNGNGAHAFETNGHNGNGHAENGHGTNLHLAPVAVANGGALQQLRGTPYDKGYQLGQIHAQQIVQLLRSSVDAHAETELDEPLQGATAQLTQLSSNELDQLQGMADAVEVPLANLLAHHQTLIAGLDRAMVTAASQWDSAVGSNGSNGTAHQNGHATSRSADFTEPAPPMLPNPSVTIRYGLEMREAPRTTRPASMNWSGAAIVLGDDEVALALRSRLERDGVVVHDLPVEEDTDQTLAELERICQQGPAPHLFITTANDALSGDWWNLERWNTRRQQTVLTPFFVCQKWIQLATAGGWLDRSTIVATTQLGGDFGFSRGAEGAAGGALAGLLKAIFIEYTVLQGLKDLRVRVIDAALDVDAAELAEDIIVEVGSDALDVEVAFVDGRRLTTTAVEQPLGAPQGSGIRRGGVWVVTGGARGITAACAMELGRRHGLRLHLIGASPAPDIDPSWRTLDAAGLEKLKASMMIAARQAGLPAGQSWDRARKDLEIDRSLRTFAEAGVDATYHSCDVADRQELAAVLEQIRNTSGPIEGILHGAGIDRSCRFDRKQRDVVDQTIGAKVDGAAHLMALTRRDPIRHFLGFGSISGRIGSFGQTDYCLSNDMLCKLLGAYRRERPWIRAVGFHWHPWDEVGMAARPETKSSLQSKVEMTLMPLAEGIAHFVGEIAAGCRSPEVLITERSHWQRFSALTNSAVVSAAAPAIATAKPGVAEANATPVAKPTAPAKKSPVVETVELLTERCVMRALPAPLSTTPQSLSLDSPVWILGDNSAAQALRAKLEAAGVAAPMISMSGDADQTLAEVERMWAEAPAQCLFLMTGRDPAPANLLDDASSEACCERGMLLPFLVTQRWHKLLASRPDLGQGTLVAAVSLGGDFGFSGCAPAPEGGAITGLLKSVAIEGSRREESRLRVKVIDAPVDEPDRSLVDSILRELAGEEPEVEVCWSRHERRVIRPLPTAIDTARNQPIPRGGVWVITGGARGITAIAARGLAERYGWKLHLVGKSPAPQPNAPWRRLKDAELKSYVSTVARQAIAAGRSPAAASDSVNKDVEIFNNLRQFADAGVSATYHSCDISDRAALATALDDIRRQDGPITGVIHGAGTIDPAKFENKRRDFVAGLIGAKIAGGLNLMALLVHDPLAYFIGFGSISGRFGSNGQTDYAAGNDGLAKLIDWYRAARPECASTCIHWESWEGSGMATQPRYAFGPKSIQMKYMQPDEGVRRLEQELEAGLPDSEVLYTFGEFYPMVFPLEQRPLGPFVPTGAAAVTATGQDAPTDEASTATEWPLLRNVRRSDEGADADAPLNPLADPFLIQHRLRGKPLLPVVVGLEIFAEVARAASGQPIVGFDNVQMLDGLLFHADRPVTAQSHAVKQADGAYACDLTNDFLNRSGGLIQKARPYLRAIARIGARSVPTVPSFASAPAQFTNVAYPEDAAIWHGAPLRCMTGVNCDRDGGWGRLVALPLADLTGRGDSAAWTVPSCVLDAAMFSCGVHLYLHGNGAVSLPKSIDHLRFGRAARDGEQCLVHFVCRELSVDSAAYDFTLMGEDGQLIAAAQGYRKVILTRGGAQ